MQFDGPVRRLKTCRRGFRGLQKDPNLCSGFRASLPFPDFELEVAALVGIVIEDARCAVET